MDAIRISFAEPLTEAGLAVVRYDLRELQDHLSTRLIAEFEEKAAENKHGTQGFQDLLAQAVHLRWDIKAFESTHFEVVGAPIHRLAGAFDCSTDLCCLWLRAATEDWIKAKLGPGFTPFKVDYPQNEALEQYAARSAGNGSGKGSGRMFRRIALVMFLVVFGVLGFTLFKVYRMVEEVNRSYTEIESTVDRKTAEIMDKLERGISTSDRVVNMVDKVKNLVAPTDTSKKAQE